MTIGCFKKAIALAKKQHLQVNIGGGEPTMHPKFNEMLEITLKEFPGPFPWYDHAPFIVTNGSIKAKALRLLELSKKQMIDARMSWDQFHDMTMVDPEVFNGFQNAGRMHGQAVRPTDTLRGRGRARQFKDAMDSCCCDTTFVHPSGLITQCGCEDSPIIGHVNAGFYNPYPHNCYHSYGFERSVEIIKEEEKLRPRIKVAA